ncbi:unnamed protein product [Cyprideis torosa]|uniref:Uncharacterized protein n=1 Tax=Cyprideis torosa TaxID=163714 RepID=A0A7R8ZUF7_9CRUS|nr:unnamed protein product [Cyprideis torosa]CAG0905868.1 unnamed protein product [Cyprideis torosa]
MRQKIRDFAAKPRHREMDCCVVVIMSHGHSDSGKDFVYSYDHKGIPVDWILNRFSNNNCAGLIKKPKLFFIQACRGDSTDRGVTCYPYSAPHKSRRPSTDRDGSNRSDANMGTPLRIPAVGQKKLPSVTDTFLARATVPGYVCFRDTVLGAWFIQTIVEVFMERAKDCELRDLMNEVSERMAKLENESGYKQAPEISMLGGFSHLYFNPGLYGTLQLPTRLSRPDPQLTPPPPDQADRSPSPVRRVTAPAGSPPVWRRSEEANGSGGSSGASSMSHEGTAEDGHRPRRPGRGLMERARRWIRGDVRDTSSLSPSSRHRGQGDNGH